MIRKRPTVPAPPGRAPGAIAAVALVLAGAALSAGPACAEPLAVALPPPLPPIHLITLLVGVHLIGLCFGLGGATMLYFWILRWLRWGFLPPEIHRTFLFVSKVVSVGLALLWLSGLGFFALYAVDAPEKIANPKLVAKIAVVVVLTVNGLLVHALVLPGVLRDVNRPMLAGLSRRRAAIVMVSGAVSGVSWYAAFALGLLRELNGRVSWELLLGLWLSAVIVASCGAYLVALRLRARGPAAVPVPARAVLAPVLGGAVVNAPVLKAAAPDTPGPRASGQARRPIPMGQIVPLGRAPGLRRG